MQLIKLVIVAIVAIVTMATLGCVKKSNDTTVFIAFTTLEKNYKNNIAILDTKNINLRWADQDFFSLKEVGSEWFTLCQQGNLTKLYYVPMVQANQKMFEHYTERGGYLQQKQHTVDTIQNIASSFSIKESWEKAASEQWFPHGLPVFGGKNLTISEIFHIRESMDQVIGIEFANALTSSAESNNFESMLKAQVIGNYWCKVRRENEQFLRKYLSDHIIRLREEGFSDQRTENSAVLITKHSTNSDLMFTMLGILKSDQRTSRGPGNTGFLIDYISLKLSDDNYQLLGTYFECYNGQIQYSPPLLDDGHARLNRKKYGVQSLFETTTNEAECTY